jgi:voltage-gated potassium channel
MQIRRRLLYALLMLVVVAAAAVVGYRALAGPSVTLLQALYMAIITLAGVGYGEIVDTSRNPALRVFNIFVVLFGVAITVYVFSVLTAFLVEADIRNVFRRRKMQKRISQLKNHYIVCGLGGTGRYAAVELHNTRTPCVVIESQEETVKKWREHQDGHLADMLYIIGDATDEAVLNEAGIERAQGLIAALPTDKDNLVVTVMARQLNPNLRIVARYVDGKFSERMLKAGANSAVSPNHIGGLRLASEVLRPHVVGFLDLMLQERSRILRIEEVEVLEGSGWIGLPLNAIKLQARYNLLPLALKNSGDPRAPRFWVNPPENVVTQAGMVIIVMGDMNDVRRAPRGKLPSPRFFRGSRRLAQIS